MHEGNDGGAGVRDQFDNRAQSSVHAPGVAEVGRPSEGVQPDPDHRPSTGPVTAGRAGFGTVVLDPPWSFDNKGSRAAADNHYQTVPSRLLHRIPLEDWMADTSAMFMWTTDSHIEEALALMKIYGFNYKQMLHWIKIKENRLQVGMGNYMRHVSETCLFGTRGKVKVKRHDVPAVIFAPRTEHSTKPAAIYQLAEYLCEGPYLEMFARERRPGWTSWGNEV